MSAVRDQVLADLRERILAIEGEGGRKSGVLAFGVPEIDGILPGGGLALGGLHELAGGGSGTVDGAAAALFAAGIAARTKGQIVWCLGLMLPIVFWPESSPKVEFALYSCIIRAGISMVICRNKSGIKPGKPISRARR